MKRIYKIVPVFAMALALGFTSCVGDLDVTPIDPNMTTELNIDGLFNKCYANFALAGNGGANGDCDVDGIDGGTSGLVRQMFNTNELTTDEAICAWLTDDGVAALNNNTYNASNPFIKGYYARLTTGIAYCNQYLSEAGDGDKQKSAEIRFLRAFQYYLLMDGFGNIPFTTTPMTKPVRYTRAEAYAFIENELKEIEGDLADAKAKTSSDANYGRVDKAADWLLLSRLYLNAEVYTGTAEWQKAADYAKKVMDSPYKLNEEGKNGWSAYQMLFMADNSESSASTEGVFPLLQDGLKTTSWGVSLFLSAACFSNDMHANPNDAAGVNGVSGQAWGGNRARPELVKKFFPTGNIPQAESYTTAELAGDDRALFWGIDRTLDVVEPKTFVNGYSVAKFTNFRSDNQNASDATFMDTDFFILRSAEAYLTYAEANARLNGGTTTGEGTEAINKIRERANASTRERGYSLSEILDEWSREFYFEGRRRIDLVRFGKFGGYNSDYKWQWKGGDYAGRNFDETKNIFPIPTSDLTANENLVQNPGY